MPFGVAFGEVESVGYLSDGSAADCLVGVPGDVLPGVVHSPTVPVCGWVVYGNFCVM